MSNAARTFDQTCKAALERVLHVMETAANLQTHFPVGFTKVQSNHFFGTGIFTQPDSALLPFQEQQSTNAQMPDVVAVDSATAKAAVAKAVVAEPDMEAERKLAQLVCSLENKDDCLMCGS